MFGTMGFSELIIILLIILIIFGAGRLPQIGEGVGKALRGFKKEVHDATPPEVGSVQEESSQASQTQPQATATNQPTTAQSQPTETRNTPYAPGPEMTPGTTASMLYQAQPKPAATSPAHATAASGPVISMEERAAAPPPMARAAYPPLPPNAQAKPAAKRPSAIVNKDAVARVQAQQAALKAKPTQSDQGLSPNDLQHVGESLGDIVRTFQQTVTETRNSIAPHVQTIKTEMDTAHKELQQSIEAAKDLPATHEDQAKSV